MLIPLIESWLKWQSIYFEKANANGKPIAFKVMRGEPTPEQLEEENKEIYIMGKLAKAMDEVTGPRCGTKLHYFRIEGHEYRGFGMERNFFKNTCFVFISEFILVFPHPTVVGVMKAAKLTMVDCSKSMTQAAKCWWARRTQDLYTNSASIRKMWLRDKNVQSLYYNSLAALRKMWSNGVVHNDCTICSRWIISNMYVICECTPTIYWLMLPPGVTIFSHRYELF